MQLAKLQQQLLRCFKSTAKEKLIENSVQFDNLKTESDAVLFELAASFLIDNIYILCVTNTLIEDEYQDSVMSSARDYLSLFATINERFKSVIDKKLPLFLYKKKSIETRPELAKILQDDIKNLINCYYYRSFFDESWLRQHRFLIELTRLFNQQGFHQKSYEDCIAIVKLSNEGFPIDVKIQKLLTAIIKFEQNFVVPLSLAIPYMNIEEGVVIQSPSVMNEYSVNHDAKWPSDQELLCSPVSRLTKGIGTVQSSSFVTTTDVANVETIIGVPVDSENIKGQIFF